MKPRDLFLCLAAAVLGQAAFAGAGGQALWLPPALACFAWAGWRLAVMKPAPAQAAWRPAPWQEACLLALILAVAVGLRLYRLDSLPDSAYRDEGQSGIVAARMLLGQEVYDTGTSTPLYLLLVPAGFFYPMALCFKVLGVSLYAVRLDTVVFAVLSIAAFYPLARLLLGAPLALAMALGLAALRWHLNFSRIGFLGMMTFYAQIPAVYFLVRAGLAEAPERTRRGGARPGGDRARMALLAGAVLGLSFYTYAAAYLLLPLAAGWLGYVALAAPGALRPGDGRRMGLWAGLCALGGVGLAHGNALGWAWLGLLGGLSLALGLAGGLGFLLSRRAAFGPWLRPLGLAALAFLACAGPMLGYYATHRQRVDDRPQRISIFQHSIPGRDPSWGHALERNVGLTLGMTNVRGDINPRHNIPDAPMLNPLWGAAAALGVAYCLWTWTQPVSFLLLLWWQTALLSGYFSIEAPQAYRTMDSMAPLLLMAGLGLRRLWHGWRGHFGRDQALAAAILALAFFGPAAGLDLWDYFQVQCQRPERWNAFSGAESAMGREYRACPPGTRALLRADWADSYAFRFGAFPYGDYAAYQPARDLPPGSVAAFQGRDLIYFFDQDELPLRDTLQRFFPLGAYHATQGPDGAMAYWSFHVPGSETRQALQIHSGLRGRYYGDGGDDDGGWRAPHWVPERLSVTETDPLLLFHWRSPPTTNGRFFSVEWTGHLAARKGGAYAFSTYSDDYTRLEIDGRPVLESPAQPFNGGWVEGTAKLGPGRHALRLRYYASKNTSELQLWWLPPGDKERSVVPTEVLSPD